MYRTTKSLLSPVVVFLAGAAALLAAEPTSKPARRPLTLRLPERNWALLIPSKGLRVQEYQLDPRGRQARFLAKNATTDLMVSAFLELAAHDGDAKACRDFYWARAKQSPVPKKDVEFFESGPIALVRYTVPQYRGMKVRQHNVNAYLAHDGLWIYVHLSKAHFEPADQKLFDDVIRHLRIAENHPPDTRELSVFGLTFFQQQDYDKAARYFQQALNLEQSKRTLNRTMWRVLVDQLGMAYGIGGNPAKAKGVFEYGISVDAEYPMFYYNLACVYAEMNDLDRAIHYLIKAFERQDNLDAGERMPDPRSDSSFTRFQYDKKFQAAIEKIASSRPVKAQ